MTDDQSFAPILLATFAWVDFNNQLREGNRFFPQDRAYVERILEACLGRVRTIEPKQEVFRARIVPAEKEFDGRPLSAAEVGLPPAKRTQGGRLNPAWMPYFYGALEEETAIAEVRPWIGARITVAKYQTYKELKVVDLSSRYEAVSDPGLSVLSHAFGRPVHRDDVWTYLGTQYVAEGIKARGVDGILYNSPMNPGGVNLALFSDIGVEPQSRTLVEVSAVAHRTAVISTHDDG